MSTVRETIHATSAAGVTIAEEDFHGLTPAVERYLRHVIPSGVPLPETVEMRQKGAFLLNGIWRQFRATERYSVARCEFAWDARIRIAPLLDVCVRDGWHRGQGSMHASVGGIIPIVRQDGGSPLNTGALLRYLAEAPWLPLAMLPRYGVLWERIDDRRARAHLQDCGVTVSLEFTFDGTEGIGVYTPSRPREVRGRYEPTPWSGRFWRYGERCGMRIPLEGEVAWIVDGEAQPYWRGTIVSVQGR